MIKCGNMTVYSKFKPFQHRRSLVLMNSFPLLPSPRIGRVPKTESSYCFKHVAINHLYACQIQPRSYSTVSKTTTQQREENNHHYGGNFPEPGRKSSILTAIVATAIALGASYSYWYYKSIQDFEKQINYVYLDHKTQFVQQAIMTALQILNTVENRRELLRNAFQELPDDVIENAQFEIVVANVFGNLNQKEKRPHTQGGEPQSGKEATQFYTSQLSLRYCLFPDVCEVNEVANGQKLSVGKCRTVLNTRCCNLEFCFLVTPALQDDVSNTRMNSFNNSNNAYRAVKVTMTALDTDLKQIPNYFVTKVALCSTEKAFPHLPAMATKRKQRINHFLDPQNNRSPSHMTERDFMQQKMIVGGEIVLEKALSIGGKVQSTNGIKKVEHVYIPPINRQ